MNLLESLKNAVAVELTTTDPSDVVQAWRVLTEALNATKDQKEIQEALEYTQSSEFIKCVALPGNYSAFVKSFLKS